MKNFILGFFVAYFVVSLETTGQIILPDNDSLSGNVKSIKYQFYILPTSNPILTNEFRTIQSFVATVDDYKNYQMSKAVVPNINNDLKKTELDKAAEIIDNASNLVQDLSYASYLSTIYETVVNYNSKGFKTQEVSKNINSHVLLKENIKYDKNNRILNYSKFESKNSMDDFGFLDESEFVTIFSEDNYFYDSKGNISEKTSTKIGLEDEKVIEQYFYNSKNELLKTQISKEVNSEKSESYIVDETKRKCISKINSEGFTVTKCTGDNNYYEKTYDKKSRLIKVVNNSIFKSTITYQYLEDKLISETHFDENNNPTSKISNTYDYKGRLDGKLLTHLNDGRKIFFFFKYHSNGRLFEIIENDITTTFNFDLHGNWIMRFDKIRGRDTTDVTHRVITYY